MKTGHKKARGLRQEGWGSSIFIFNASNPEPGHKEKQADPKSQGQVCSTH